MFCIHKVPIPGVSESKDALRGEPELLHTFGHGPDYFEFATKSGHGTFSDLLCCLCFLIVVGDDSAGDLKLILAEGEGVGLFLVVLDT